MRLSDGTVVPSYMRLGSSSGSNNVFSARYLNNSLREGYVLGSYPPQKGINKTAHWLYDVQVYHSDGDEAGSPIVYRHVRKASLFGSVGDKEYTKLREEPLQSNPKNNNDSLTTRGSRVLILCINGKGQEPYVIIVGALPHPYNSEVDSIHHMQELNGVRYEIAEDGGIVYTIKGPTDLDGKVTKAIDTKAEMDSSGNTSLTCKGDLKVNTDGNTVFTANQIKAGSDGSHIPVMMADPSYVAALNSLTTSLQVLATAVVTISGLIAATGAALATEPLLSTSKAADGALSGAPVAAAAALVAVSQAVIQVQSTLQNSIAISTKLFSE